MLDTLLGTSKTVTLLKVIWRKCYYSLDSLERYYINSRACNLINLAFNKIRVILENSSLERFTELKEEENTPALDNSLIAGYAWNRLVAKMKILRGYANASRVISSLREAGRESYRAPIKAAGIIIYCAVLTDIFLLLFFKKQISLSGWAIRGVFLIIGGSCIFSAVDWFTLEDNSTFLRKILKKR